MTNLLELAGLEDKESKKGMHLYIYTTDTYSEKKWFKVGQTTQENINERVKQQDGTSNPEPLVMVKAWENAGVTDKEVHSYLTQNGIKFVRTDARREWFKGSLDKIVSLVDEYLNIKHDDTEGGRDQTELKLREYQQEAIEKAIAETSGAARLVMPTGAGKTVVESYVVKHMLDNTEEEVHLVMAPRIVLLDQLARDFSVSMRGTAYHSIMFRSGREPEADPYRELVKNTTEISKVKEALEKARMMGQKLIIFSTYHSVGKLVNHFDFGTVIADESQYCIEENKFKSVSKLKARLKLFFTATEKYSTNSDRSQDNEAVFGKKIFEVTPKFLIEKGFIVPPAVHVMTAHGTINESTNIIASICEISKGQHVYTTEQDGMPYSKILVACKKGKHVTTIRKNVKLIKKHLPTHRIFTISSGDDSRIDGVKVPRAQFMREMRDTEENAIIVHYNILAEGIDVDGITGVIIMRTSMGKSKLLQTIGRSLRLYKQDKGKPMAERLKRRAHVSLPLVTNDDKNNHEEIINIVKSLREEGFEDYVNWEEILTAAKQHHEKKELDQGDLEDLVDEVEDDQVYENDWITSVEHFAEQIDGLAMAINVQLDKEEAERISETDTVEGIISKEDLQDFFK